MGNVDRFFNKYFNILGKIRSIILVVWQKYMAAYGKSVKDGYVSNAYAPLVWFVVFLIIPFILGIIFIHNTIVQYVLIGLIAIIVLFSLVMYVVLLVKDPKLLQSESYRLEDKKLDLIAQQGDGGSITVIESQNIAEIRGEINE